MGEEEEVGGFLSINRWKTLGATCSSGKVAFCWNVSLVHKADLTRVHTKAY